jgi:hypothetical protein
MWIEADFFIPAGSLIWTKGTSASFVIRKVGPHRCNTHDGVLSTSAKLYFSRIHHNFNTA